MKYLIVFFFPLLFPVLAIAEGGTETSLKSQLAALAEKYASQSSPESKQLAKTNYENLKKSGILERALKKGDKARDFVLTDATWKKVRLELELKKGPVVLVWYRGGWCPYCNLTLRAFQLEALEEIKKQGAQLIAISPELPNKSLSTREKNDLDFVVLSDAGNVVAKQYGLVFKVPESVRPFYRDELKLAEFNGDENFELPLAATYVIDQDGIIQWAFLDADYKKRAEPAEVVRALRDLKK